jgi:hypothetical protein
MDETATKEPAERPAVEGESPTVVETRPPVTVKCLYCGDPMVHEVWPRFSRGFGIVVLIVGLLLSVFMSILLGLPVVVFGVYLWIASRNVWACRECGAVVDRA